MSHPKFILVSDPAAPLVGTFVYGLVDQHKDLLRAYEEVHGYQKVHGGGWYLKDDDRKTMTLYGSSGDYGEPRLSFLNRIPSELEGYTFLFTPFYGMSGNVLELEGGGVDLSQDLLPGFVEGLKQNLVDCAVIRIFGTLSPIFPENYY